MAWKKGAYPGLGKEQEEITLDSERHARIVARNVMNSSPVIDLDHSHCQHA